MGNEVSSPAQVANKQRLAPGQNGKAISGATPNDSGDIMRQSNSNRTSSTAELTTPGRASPSPNGRRSSAPKASARSSRAASMKQEESISVNLPMTELMAYLQVVASNSSNLPNTRRDDPELGRMISSLISDEYEAKSSAFIPSDFKIISGSFLKYGKVWDLPTSEEYTPIDGAQEPGCSYGGACTNSFLKTMYDSENASDKYNHTTAPSGDEDSTYIPTDSRSMPSLDMGELTMPSNMSWVDLLEKMKAEIEQTGFCQIPQITSSTRLDLSKPVSLVPPKFDPSVNKKRSLLIGCNYSDYGKGAELKASHDDVNSMQDYIVNIHGFSQNKDFMTVLMDDGKKKPPTYKNITDAFRNLSETSKAGDVVFVHYSGHGCRVLDSPIDSDVDAYDEGIVPSDFGKEGILRDTLIFKTLIAPMRKGVTVTCVFDACDTGVMVDLPFSWQAKGKELDEKEIATSVNPDFSFVRFLKVIKTLYESSTFTQLGKTVHCVLDEKSPTSVRPYDDYSLESNSYDDGSLETVDKENAKPSGSSFFNAISACRGSALGDSTAPKLKMNMTDISDMGSPVTAKSESIGGIIQQMLTCTVPFLDDDVDEDQRQARMQQLNDNTTLGDASSYGTDFYSEDDLSAASPGRSLTSR